MAGKGSVDLPRPPRRYDPRGRAGFETLEACEKEDRTRARLLRRTALAHPALAEDLLSLADAIDPAVTDRPQTPASSRWMRQHRRRLIGALWRLYDEA